MPYDNKLFRPDFQAPQVQLPQWQQMGDGGASDFGAAGGSFVDTLKKRIAQGAKPVAPGGAHADASLGGHEATLAKPMSSGGGASSL